MNSNVNTFPKLCTTVFTHRILFLFIIVSLTLPIAGKLYNSFKHQSDYKLMDGVFQVVNPVMRIESGYKPGADFDVFHGEGLPYLFYLAYVIGGRNVHAINIARYMYSLLFFILGITVFIKYFFHDKSQQLLVATALVFFTIAYAPALYLPENSLYSTRTGLVPLFFVLFAIEHKTKSLPWMTSTFIAMLYYIAVDQFMMLLLSYAALLPFLFIFSSYFGVGKKTIFLRATCRFAFILLLIVGLGIIITQSPTGFVKTALYHFRDMSADQFWYFGAPPNKFIYSIRMLLFNNPYRFFIYVSWALLVLILLIKKNGLKNIGIDNAVIYFIGIYSILSCTIPCLGIDVNKYCFSGMKFTLLSLCIFLSALEWPHVIKIKLKYIVAVSVAALVLFSVIFTIHSTINDSTEPKYGADYYTLVCDAVSEPSDFWATYTGYYNAKQKVLPANSVDYIIHALGKNGRQTYLDEFNAKKPSFVETMRLSRTKYIDWLHKTTWPFYATINANYDVATTTKSTVILHRKNMPWKNWEQIIQENQWISIPTENLNIFEIPPLEKSDEIYMVKLTYRAKHILPKPFSSLARYLIECPSGVPVPLPPYKNEIYFPVCTEQLDGSIRLIPKVFSIFPGASLDIESCEICIMKLSSQLYNKWFMNQ